MGTEQTKGARLRHHQIAIRPLARAHYQSHPRARAAEDRQHDSVVLQAEETAEGREPEVRTRHRRMGARSGTPKTGNLPEPPPAVRVAGGVAVLEADPAPVRVEDIIPFGPPRLCGGMPPRTPFCSVLASVAPVVICSVKSPPPLARFRSPPRLEPRRWEGGR